MQATVLNELGPSENLRLQEVADPRAGAGEVVVALRAAALNRRDVWIRRGLYPAIQLPAILGSDGAGIVTSVGEGVDSGLVGQEVVLNPSLEWGPDPAVQGPNYRILGMPDQGTYAQQIRISAANICPKPAGLSWEESAALPLAGLTAYRALVTRAGVRAGETVLVTGVGGGVSAFALQIARALGARVFVTSGSDAKIARAMEIGAAGGVNYRADGWTRTLTQMSGGGPDIVIDSAGGESFARALDIVKPGGRVVTYGATTGRPKEINLQRLFWAQIQVFGSTMGTAAEFDAMLRLYHGEGLRPVVDSVFPLSDAAAAHRRMEEAEQLGKIVLRIPE